jgi:hypothetical protein
MPNKTPYELRFDVLSMARDLCMDEYHQKANAFWQLHQSLETQIEMISHHPEAVDKARRLSQELINAVPTMPTSDQINRRAKELYEFVESK